MARRRATPIRLTLTSDLGQDIDGAWWPRTDRIGGELPDLVLALSTRLGEITGINVNWPSLERPPDLNWRGWQLKHQHVISVNSCDTCANVLIIPYATNSTLAMMMLRRAANLPIDPAYCETASFHTAGSILYAARQQFAADRADSSPR
ncbi:hypothetical protein A5636_09595 [Mycobacterium asiaticum]|uniref:Uncharacterized protein n=1 Tax=Mycobacterium asiaticum TaxID=1790 RepID=A0A1A3MTU5_MYCAS|nr:hypothetical protein A5636_09595 [Mycobacterium asiaticum]